MSKIIDNLRTQWHEQWCGMTMLDKIKLGLRLAIDVGADYMAVGLVKQSLSEEDGWFKKSMVGIASMMGGMLAGERIGDYACDFVDMLTENDEEQEGPSHGEREQASAERKE